MFGSFVTICTNCRFRRVGSYWPRRLDRDRSVVGFLDSYMTGMPLTGTGKGFLSLDGGALTADGAVGLSAGMTSEENLIFCFLRSTSALT